MLAKATSAISCRLLRSSRQCHRVSGSINHICGTVVLVTVISDVRPGTGRTQKASPRWSVGSSPSGTASSDRVGQLLLGQSIVADRLRTAQVEQDAQPQDQAHQQGREQKIAGCFVPHKHTFLRNTSMNLAKSGCQGIVNKVY